MIALHIRLHVEQDRRPDLEKTYVEVFLPALRVQPGFRGSSLYRTFAPELASEINAAQGVADYVVELRFETEASRRAWVASQEHATAWPQLRGAASQVSHVGSDVLVSEVFEALDSTLARAGAGT